MKKRKKKLCVYGNLFVLIVLLVAIIEEEIDMGLKFDNQWKENKNREKIDMGGPL